LVHAEYFVVMKPRFRLRLTVPMNPIIFLGLALASPLFFLAFTILIIVGLNPLLAFTLTMVSLLSSPLNIVFLEVTYYITPIVDFIKLIPLLHKLDKLHLGLNIGGSVIPTLVSSYLLSTVVNNQVGLVVFLVSLAASSYVIKVGSKLIPGVGVVVPSALPIVLTLSLTIIAHAFTGVDPLAFSYSLGSLSTLIGADLLNLRRVINEVRGFVSIGGMGVFDGIYLTGLASLILSSIV